MTAINPTQIKTASLNQAPKAGAAPSSAKPGGTKTAAGDDKFSFWDLVDIINPLQHIPVVSTIYREITGDKISNFSRIAGGALFGGFIGAAIGGVNAIAVNETGEDVGELAMTKLGLKDAPAPVQTASKPPISTDNIPVIDVHPSAEKMAQATHEKITWDKPDRSGPALAKAEQIIWDPAPKTVMASAPQAAQMPLQAPLQAVEKSTAPAPQLAAAMPSPKDLNTLEPSASDTAASTVPQQVAKAQVPDAMLKALAKYQSMQHLGDPAATNQIQAADMQTGRKFAGLDKTVRRY